MCHIIWQNEVISIKRIHGHKVFCYHIKNNFLNKIKNLRILPKKGVYGTWILCSYMILFVCFRITVFCNYVFLINPAVFVLFVFSLFLLTNNGTCIFMRFYLSLNYIFSDVYNSLFAKFFNIHWVKFFLVGTLEIRSL